MFLPPRRYILYNMEKKNIIEILDRFFQGLTTKEEDQVLKAWIKEPGSREEFYQYFHQCWHLASNEMDEELQNEMLVEILSRIDSDPSTSKEEKHPRQSNIRPLFRRILNYAAVACLVLAVGIGTYHIGKNNVKVPEGVITMEVENGQKADIVLADGTKVYINSASKITYDNAYNKKDRILKLEGEAYFEVAKDENKPFMVNANGITVEALGTSFNVKAHKSSNYVAVTLIEGKVRTKDNFNERYLNPNERVEYSLITGKFQEIEKLHPNADHLLWRSRELAFYGESVEEVCATLTRMYNCNFLFKSDAVKKYTYNGVLKNSSLDNVLESISRTAGIRYDIKPNNTIVIY